MQLGNGLHFFVLNMKISNIITYPLKSSQGNELSSSIVTSHGLLHDRFFAVTDDFGNVLTAREYPQLLSIKTSVRDNRIQFDSENLFYKFKSVDAYSTIKIFGTEVLGVRLPNAFSDWISNLLGVKAHIVELKEDSRKVKEKYNSINTDVLSLADVSPIHLISKSSIDDLNLRLSESDKVSIANFRPNLVVENSLPYEEDQWSQIQINNCVFDVHYKAARCLLSTIDSKTFEKNVHTEPLRTLSKYKKNNKGEVCFGVYLIPRKLGKININDSLKVLK